MIMYFIGRSSSRRRGRRLTRDVEAGRAHWTPRPEILPAEPAARAPRRRADRTGPARLAADGGPPGRPGRRRVGLGAGAGLLVGAPRRGRNLDRRRRRNTG